MIMKLAIAVTLLAVTPATRAEPFADRNLPVVTHGPAIGHDPYFTQVFDPKADAMAEVDKALLAARDSGRRVLLVMGENNCHDSAFFANTIKGGRFTRPMDARYHVVFVFVGAPQAGRGHNLDVAQRFGFRKIKGTPTVAILDAEGHVLNRKAAPKWRNAASRSDDEIYDELMQ